MFLTKRPEAERISRTWSIKKKARDSKYAVDIEQIRVVTTCRNIAEPQLCLYRMGIIHCLEGIDEHLDDICVVNTRKHELFL